MKKLLFIVIVVLLVILGVKASQSEPTETGPITIGFVGPLTGGGAFYGLEDKQSIELAVEEINEDGGINGRLIEVIYEDGKCNGPDALSAAQKLVNVDGVKIILGGTCSGETLAMAPFTEENEVLVLSGYSSSGDVTEAGDFVFRTVYSESETAGVVAEFAKDNKHQSIAAITENTEFATNFTNSFVENFESLGGEIVANEFYPPDSTDARAIVTKVIAKNPDAVVISPQGDSGATVIRQLRELGYEGDLYGNSVASTGKVVELAGEAIDGIYFSQPADIAKDNADAQAFLRDYEVRFGEKPAAYPVFSAGRYSSIHMLAEAIAKVGEDTTSLRDYLYDLKPYPGLTYSISFDENGDAEGIEFGNYQLRNGQNVLVN